MIYQNILKLHTLPEVGSVFMVVGVKKQDSSLELLEKRFPGQIKMQRFPEVVNAKYLNYNKERRDEHILQCALVTVVAPVPAKAPAPKRAKKEIEF